MRWMLAAVLAMMPATLRADWQFTHWGDSLETVLQYNASGMMRVPAARFADQRADAFAGEVLATSLHQVAGSTTTVYYYFKNGKLTAVQIAFRNRSEAYRALDALKSQYGRPVDELDVTDRVRRRIDMRWRDTVGGNIVRFMMAAFLDGSAGYEQLLYKPLPEPGASGL